MKTNKQQTVILILLVIPTTILAIVTTNATSQQALAKSESSRGQTDARICYSYNIQR
jgi:hypothetical protein